MKTDRRSFLQSAAFLPAAAQRAAGPALLSNIGRFEKRIIRWDPEKMVEKA